MHSILSTTKKYKMEYPTIEEVSVQACAHMTHSLQDSSTYSKLADLLWDLFGSSSRNINLF